MTAAAKSGHSLVTLPPVLLCNCDQDADSARSWRVQVYDVTEYVDIHPGADAILRNAGRDSTDGFFGPQHPPTTVDLLAEYYIGDLKT